MKPKVKEFDNGEMKVTYKCITDGIDEVDFSFDNPLENNEKKFLNIAVDSKEYNVNISKENALHLADTIYEFFGKKENI